VAGQAKHCLEILVLAQPLPERAFADFGLASGSGDRRRLEQGSDGAVLAGSEAVEVVSVIWAVSGFQRVMAIFTHPIM